MQRCDSASTACPGQGCLILQALVRQPVFLCPAPLEHCISPRTTPRDVWKLPIGSGHRLDQKSNRLAAVRRRAETGVEGAPAAPVNIFERNAGRAARVAAKTPATSAQLGPPNWISASTRRAARRRGRRSPRVRRAPAVATPAAPSTANSRNALDPTTHNILHAVRLDHPAGRRQKGG